MAEAPDPHGWHSQRHCNTEQSNAKTHESRKTTDGLMAEEEADGKLKRSHSGNKKGSVGREMARAGRVEAKED